MKDWKSDVSEQNSDQRSFNGAKHKQKNKSLEDCTSGTIINWSYQYIINRNNNYDWSY